MVILTLEGSKLPLKIVEAGNSKTETVLAIVQGGACACRSVWREEDGKEGEDGGGEEAVAGAGEDGKGGEDGGVEDGGGEEAVAGAGEDGKEGEDGGVEDGGGEKAVAGAGADGKGGEDGGGEDGEGGGE